RTHRRSLSGLSAHRTGTVRWIRSRRARALPPGSTPACPRFAPVRRASPPRASRWRRPIRRWSAEPATGNRGIEAGARRHREHCLFSLTWWGPRARPAVCPCGSRAGVDAARTARETVSGRAHRIEGDLLMRPEHPPQRAKRRSRAHPGAALAIAAATIAAALSVPAQAQAIEAPATSAHHDTTSTLIDADLEAIELTEPVMGNLPLITRGTEHGSTITWTSSDPDVVTGTDEDYQAPETGAADPYAGGGIVTRPAYGAGDMQVTVTAHATLNGTSGTREFTLTIAEQGRSAPDVGYAAAYFKSDSDERVYQAATTGNDFFSF